MAIERQALIEALEAGAGVHSAAGQILGVTGARVGQLVKGDAELERIVAEQIGRVNDKARANIIAAINKGDLKQSAWWLEKRDPEFKPKHQLTGKDDAPLFNPDMLAGLNEDELAAVLAIRRRASAGPDGGT